MGQKAKNVICKRRAISHADSMFQLVWRCLRRLCKPHDNAPDRPAAQRNLDNCASLDRRRGHLLCVQIHCKLGRIIVIDKHISAPQRHRNSYLKNSINRTISRKSGGVSASHHLSCHDINTSKRRTSMAFLVA